MAGWEQQMESDRRRFEETMTPIMKRLEINERKSRGLRAILEAERLAAKRDTTESNEQEMKDVVNR